MNKYQKRLNELKKGVSYKKISEKRAPKKEKTKQELRNNLECMYYRPPHALIYFARYINKELAQTLLKIKQGTRPKNATKILTENGLRGNLDRFIEDVQNGNFSFYFASDKNRQS